MRPHTLKQTDLDPSVFEGAPEVFSGGHRTNGIGKHAHAKPPSGRREQRLPHRFAQLIIAEDVRLQQHFLPGGLDRLAHAGERRFSVCEQRHGRAEVQWPAIDALHQVAEMRIAHAGDEATGNTPRAPGTELTRDDGLTHVPPKHSTDPLENHALGSDVFASMPLAMYTSSADTLLG